MNRIALVTGGASGVGFEIVKKLCQRFPGTVYFTSIDADEGKIALAELENNGLTAKYMNVDIRNHNSVIHLMKTIKYTEGLLDLLINNEETKFNKPYEEPLSNIAFKTLSMNYEGTRDFSKEMFYVMRRGSKVLNVTTEEGSIENIPNIEFRRTLSNPHLAIATLDSLVAQYKDSVSRGTCLEDGWGDDPYIVSKAFVTALTSVHAAHMVFLGYGANISCINTGPSESKCDDQDQNSMEKRAGRILVAALDS